jgi:hypothetical protein
MSRSCTTLPTIASVACSGTALAFLTFFPIYRSSAESLLLLHLFFSPDLCLSVICYLFVTAQFRRACVTSCEVAPSREVKQSSEPASLSISSQSCVGKKSRS